MKTKICKNCFIEKPITEFFFHLCTQDGYRPNCKSCVSEYNREYRKQNRERILEQDRKYAANHREEAKTRVREWRLNNPEKKIETNNRYYQKTKNVQLAKAKERYQQNKDVIKQKIKQWKINNPDKVIANNAKRRAEKRKAVPKWANINHIQKIYKKARNLTESTGVQYQVDHIVPLISKEVCGLHCEHNLRIITAKENNAKKNKLIEELL